VCGHNLVDGLLVLETLDESSGVLRAAQGGGDFLIIELM
jgi:hypothetical protein